MESLAMDSLKAEKRPLGSSHLRLLASNSTKRRRFTCDNPGNNISDYPALKACLPGSFDYHVCQYSSAGDRGDHHSYTATLRMALPKEEEVKQWLKAHSVTWRVDRTVPGKGQKVLFKVEYRCQHNTRPRKVSREPTKNTNCPAKMSITVLRAHVSRGRQSRSADPHLPGFPTVVVIKNDHNHNLHTADALRHRDVGDAAKARLQRLFEAGHSPSSALDVLKRDLQAERGDDYVLASADRALCPTLEFCYRLYRQLFSQEYGGPEGAKTADEVAFVDEEWDLTCTELRAAVRAHEELQGAAAAFIQTFNKIKHNPSALASALRAFGRHGALNWASRRARALQSASSHAGPATAARPAPAAQRKVKVGAGRRPAAGGALKTAASRRSQDKETEESEQQT